MSARRSFSQKFRAELFLAQRGKCADCGCILMPSRYHADHRKPLFDGGTNDPENIVLICLSCHKAKSISETKSRAKADRIAAGGKQKRGRGFRGWRKFSGEIVWRDRSDG